MAARVVCSKWKCLFRTSAEHYRLFGNLKILAVATSDSLLPSKQNKRLYHCINVQNNSASLSAVSRISSYGKRHQGKLAHRDKEADKVEDTSDEEGSFEKYGIPKSIQRKLEAKGIHSLFPVQYETYKETKEGWDVVVQARTGTGKTLSFAIPLVENIEKTPNRRPGRKPTVIILEPTRELVVQVAEDIRAISESVKVTCIYGGTSYIPQLNDLSDGVDIVIGCPGRVQDMINQGNLSLDDIEHVVLDEVDRMLDMGFSDSVEEIVHTCYEKKEKPQTMLYSATMPPWVFKVARKYLKNNFRHVDLVGHDDVQTSVTVEHMALTCRPKEISSLLHDVIRVHCGQHGRTMIFCQTKKECDQLASETLHKLESQVLHGDIPQERRDIVIRAFKSGKHKVLITTDVAARGLDIPNVELVIQTSPPQSADYYIHRSGRTGRAGKTGKSIIFFGPSDFREQQNIENAANLKFKKISPPTPDQIIRASAQDVKKHFDKVLPETLEHFKESAQELIEERGAEDALAAAMAVIAGATEIKSRSLLTSREGYTTYILRSDVSIRTTRFVYGVLIKQLTGNLVSALSNITCLQDQTGAVFDIPSDLEEEVESAWVQSPRYSLEKASELPELVESHSFGSFLRDREKRSFGEKRNKGFSRQFDRGDDRPWKSKYKHNTWASRADGKGFIDRDSFNKRRISGRIYSSDDEMFQTRMPSSRQTRQRRFSSYNSDDDF